MIDVNIKNLKGIKELKYTIPERNGVYVLSASNGCGKTTLLVAIDRIGNNMAFTNYNNCNNASISYTVDNQKVVYTKKDQKWSPVPKKCRAILNKLQRDTYYLSATGYRLYQQNNEDLKKKLLDAPQNIKTALNKILDTSKFNDLKYITVVPKKGRQKNLHRNNILYVIKNARETYSELNFSLGERMLLNALDFINTVKENSILLIDEIELALHPIAQVKFYEYLCDVAKVKKLIVIISTHSSTLIKRARVLHYLDNEDGVIRVNYDATPAIVLKEVSVELDNKPDYVFFVEDMKALCYMKCVLQKYRETRKEDASKVIQVLPVGGKKEVVNLMIRMQNVPPFDPKCLHCFLDRDVRDDLENPNIPVYDEGFRKLLIQYGRHIDYLHITPELGVWNALKDDHMPFNRLLEGRFGQLVFRLKDIIDEIDHEKRGVNEREVAKKCLNEFCDKLSAKLLCEKSAVEEYVFQSFVNSKFESKEYREEVINKIKKALNKAN